MFVMIICSRDKSRSLYDLCCVGYLLLFASLILVAYKTLQAAFYRDILEFCFIICLGQSKRFENKLIIKSSMYKSKYETDF